LDKFKLNTFIDRKEARKVEKVFGAREMWSKNVKEKESSKRWMKVLRDPKIFKK
jgi:hypothetical protein